MESQTLKEKVINFYFHRSGDTVQYKQKLIFQVNLEKSIYLANTKRKGYSLSNLLWVYEGFLFTTNVSISVIL